MTAPDPATVAGKALLEALDRSLSSLPRSRYAPAILAIEAEAASAAEARAERAEVVVAAAKAWRAHCFEEGAHDDHAWTLAAAVDAWTEAQRP